MGQAGSKGPAVSKDPQAEPAPAVSTEVVSIDEVSPNDIVIVWVSNISIFDTQSSAHDCLCSTSSLELSGHLA